MIVEKTVNQTKQDNTIKPNKHTINPAGLDRRLKQLRMKSKFLLKSFRPVT